MSGRDVAWPTWAGSLVALGAFAYSALLFFEHGVDAAMAAACAALLGIFVARLVTRQTPAHDLHSLVLSLLMVFAGTVLQQQFSYGLVLVGYTICVTWALVTRQLVHGAAMQAYRTGNWAAHAHTLARRDVLTPLFFVSTAGVALVILLGTGVLFVAFPRVGLGGFGFGHAHGSRFPSNVSLAGPPRAGGDDTVVARIWGIGYNDFTHGIYLRGSVYDDAHTAGFSSSEQLLSIRPTRLALAAGQPDEADAQAAGRVQYDVFLQPISEQVLLAAGYVDSAESSPGAQALMLGTERVGYGPSGELVSMTQLNGAVRYQVRGTITQVPPPTPARSVEPSAPEELGFADAHFVAHFLAMPQGVDPRVQALGAKVVGDATSYGQKAARLRRYLMDNYGYSLVQTNGARPDPLASFLFDDKKGHCEYFATAFAVLLRSVGVPSRVIGGFQGGIWDPTGPTLIFTSAHAHAWVEWYQPGAGWLADDATPFRPAAELSGMAAWLERLRRTWDDEIVDFGLDQQLAMVRGVVSALQPNGLQGGSALSPGQLPWRRIFAVLGAAGVLLAAMWLVRRLGRGVKETSLRPSAVAQGLVQAIERLGQTPVPASSTLRQAVAQLEPRLLAHQNEALTEALLTYEQLRFADASVPPKQQQSILKTLRALR
ncbi:hypothetical protein Q3G72_030395 [Acer saccharum]|nr:hypothetical protein Q3G72_030395 [Acer saccharum]